MAHAYESRNSALYNGVSNRSRGWKSRRPGDVTETPAPHATRHTAIRRWDGKTRTSTAWDGLRRDPELWYRHGNCFVHLYARGQSRRGPSFKVPISTLLAAQCHSLVERFITRDMPATPDIPTVYDVMNPTPVPPPLATLDYWSRAHLVGRVDIYIPPPKDVDRDQTFLYYLAIRNLFAWVFRRPVVGEHLGSALAGLYSAMREFRYEQADNVQDLLCYLEDEGYAAMAGQPVYALALLHLAETMQFRALYIDAFSHCVGMYNDLHLGTEYQYISSDSRKLVRRARLDMDMRLGSAGSMLSNFLEDALSETHLGLPDPARAHLDRFRTYVQGFYTSRLGYYPPRSLDTRSTIFEPHVYRRLSDDFKAMYDFLVDENFTADANAPPLAQGGFCVLQSVTSFDERHGFTTMQHPLPLLPEVAHQPVNTASAGPSAGNNKAGGFGRRMSLFGGKTMDRLLLSRSEKLKPDTRLLANAALLKASNKVRPDLWHNEFVGAYRQFEEDSVFKPYKADRMEKISMLDARKVRWILIYAVHQTLQNCFLPPPAEVNGAGAVHYHMSISPKHLPTWDDGHEVAQSLSVVASSPVSPTISTAAAWPTELPVSADKDNDRWDRSDNDAAPPARCMSMTALPDAPTMQSLAEIGSGERGRALSPVFDIRPDIDYLGLAKRGDASPQEGEVVMLPRSRSLTRSLSQKAAFRRSLSLFRANNGNNATTPSTPSSASPKGPNKLQKAKQLGMTEPVPALPTCAKRNSILHRAPSQPKSEKQRAVSRERPKHSPYHEIVVHGYGNGTNPVQLAVSTDGAGPSSSDMQTSDNRPNPADDSVATPSTSRSLSTSSTTSNTSALTAETALTTYTDAANRNSIGCAITTATLPPLPDSIASFGDTALGALQTLSRSSSVYSNASSKATRTPGSNAPTPTPTLTPATVGVAVDMPPTIPPRGRGRAVPVVHPSPSLSRSSSVYSTVSMRESGAGLALPSASPSASVLEAPLPPPVPVRNSARHRRFSVYGGGDEYASVLPLATPPRAMRLVPDAKRTMPVSLTAAARQQNQHQNQKQYHSGRRGGVGTPHRSRTMPNIVSSNLAAPTQPYHSFDTVQEAMRAVRETLEQQQSLAPMPLSVPISRASSFVGVAALRSVHEEEDDGAGNDDHDHDHDDAQHGAGDFLSMAPVVKPLMTRSQSMRMATAAAAARHRHSSYIGPRDSGFDHGYHDDDATTDEVQPEWEKFAMGLGGHTTV
ncbi:hypothetical protein HMPREF1624_06902 [Sporothrix schenckii ATCC 58251]|uniref:DUF8004 domain-containing protein n=1 Tax=Sporothrix schenckii (strain ATCC 58251 / de Perez 2211183) TaxID=1391915 RepID=U7PM16_SPOS1|nr:hypothetical protein HMPREF1624_06902 [Sporothrix schenckii ATCC 58251]